MTCPYCNRSNTEHAATCAGCGTRLAPDIDPLSGADLVDAPTKLDRGATRDPRRPALEGPTLTTGAFSSRPAGGPDTDASGRIAPGTRLGNRYEILAVLGE